MPTRSDRPQDPKDLSKLVEQSVTTLQEVDRRLQMVRTDLANLISHAGTLQRQAVPGSAPSLEAPGLYRGPVVAPQLGAPIGYGGPLLHPGMSFAAQGYGASPYGSTFPAASGQPAPSTTPAFPSRTGRDGEGFPPIPRLPSVDLVDQGREFVLHIELPGVKKDDLDLTVSDRTVSLNAEVRPDVGDGAVLLGERGPVVYRRIIPLPTEVVTTQSSATFKDGILTLTVPKKVPSEGPRKLDVAYG